MVIARKCSKPIDKRATASLFLSFSFVIADLTFLILQRIPLRFYLGVFARVLSNLPIRLFTIELCYCLPDSSRVILFSISAQVAC